MKRIILILNCLLLLLTGLLLAQSGQEKVWEKKIFEWEEQIEIQIALRTKLLYKSDSLISAIQDIKTDRSLNVFQRQQLERLLKTSQQNGEELKKLNQEIVRLEQQYQTELKNIVTWHEQQIDSVLNGTKAGSKSIKEQEFAYEKVKNLKTDRDYYSKKIKPISILKVPGSTLAINEFDSYQKIKQKADLLKDQEEKIRKQKQLLANQTTDLENELKLRSRMNELISDTYLMDYNTELPSQSALAIDEKSGTNATFNYDEMRSKGFSAAAPSTLDAADVLILLTDVSEVSTLDLEHYIQRLRLVEKQLIKSADSLQIKANQFYQAAEKKKKEIKQ